MTSLGAQGPAFTYQGRLTDQSMPANGVYDFEFRLYDQSLAQIGTTLMREDVVVTNGVFTVTLDFGLAAFNGQQCSLEIALRPATSTGAFNTLTPRQPITSSPYALRTFAAENAATSDDAQRLGGVPASEYVKTDDPRLVPGPPLAGSPNYIQNGTALQGSASFNISGDGIAGGSLSANSFNALTQYNIRGAQVMRATASGNTYVGFNAGNQNVQQGVDNSFFGFFAGFRNTGGSHNSAFGSSAGHDNATGSANSFFGTSAGGQNVDGTFNSFFGYSAGYANVSGNYNTFVGFDADAGSPNLTNATAIGADARVDTSNSLILGNEVNVGIGTSAPTERLMVKTATNKYGLIHTDGNITLGTFVGGAGQGGYIGTRSNHPLHFFVNDGPASMTLDTSGKLRLNNLGSAGIASLCINASNQVGLCSSSLRYKTNIAPLTSGLELVKLLQPITFDWKANGEHDLGLGAEDVARVAPLLVVHNAAGEVEGVKYDRIAVVLVNAIREQQQQMELQQSQLKELKELIALQQSQIKQLEKLLLQTPQRAADRR